MGARSRRKGAAWERKVAQLVRERLGLPARRGFQYRDGAEAPDVITPLFHLECKHGAQPSPLAALAQAEADCRAGVIPVAVVKRDRERPTVTLALDDFLEIVAAWLRETGDLSKAESIATGCRAPFVGREP